MLPLSHGRYQVLTADFQIKHPKREAMFGINIIENSMKNNYDKALPMKFFFTVMLSKCNSSKAEFAFALIAFISA